MVSMERMFSKMLERVDLAKNTLSGEIIQKFINISNATTDNDNYMTFTATGGVPHADWF
jgi:hypothetical protein